MNNQTEDNRKECVDQANQVGSVKVSYGLCGREQTFKEKIAIRIKEHQEIVEGLQALYRNLPTEVNDRDDRSIRNAFKGSL